MASRFITLSSNIFISWEGRVRKGWRCPGANQTATVPPVAPKITSRGKITPLLVTATNGTQIPNIPMEQPQIIAVARTWMLFLVDLRLIWLSPFDGYFLTFQILMHWVLKLRSSTLDDRQSGTVILVDLILLEERICLIG